MKTIVLTIKDDICAKNGKDPEGTALIDVARTYGTVESGDAFLATERAKYESTIRALTAQIDSIKENEVTVEELELLRAIRKKSAGEISAYEAELSSLKAQLQKVAADSEEKARQIRTILGV